MKTQRDATVDEAVAEFKARRDLEASEAHLVLARTLASVQSSGLARSFYEQVDDSAGEAGCHPWRGFVNKSWAPGYENGLGEFVEMRDVLGTSLVHRIAVILHFGVPIPPDHDVYPACGEHLCCNVDHLKIRPHSGKQARKIGVYVERFFCSEAVAA